MYGLYCLSSYSIHETSFIKIWEPSVWLTWWSCHSYRSRASVVAAKGCSAGRGAARRVRAFGARRAFGSRSIEVNEGTRRGENLRALRRASRLRDPNVPPRQRRRCEGVFVRVQGSIVRSYGFADRLRSIEWGYLSQCMGWQIFCQLLVMLVAVYTLVAIKGACELCATTRQPFATCSTRR